MLNAYLASRKYFWKKVVTGGPEKKVSEQTRGVRRCKDLRPTFKKIQKFHLQTLKSTCRAIVKAWARAQTNIKVCVALKLTSSFSIALEMAVSVDFHTVVIASNRRVQVGTR